MTDKPPDPSGFAADWATIWRSEWAAMAVDRELQEHMQRLAVQAATAPAPQAPDAPGRARPEPPPRPAPAADAPDAARDGRDTVAALQQRVHELERQLAERNQP